MGSSNSKIITYNTTFAKQPNLRKKYENIVYKYLFPKYRFVTQYHLYDFYLVDYNLYIELDEEHHFMSNNSTTKKTNAIKDNIKIIFCLNHNAPILRISWFDVNNGQFKKKIKRCIKKKQPKLYLSSKDIYTNHEMLKDIEQQHIQFL